MGRYKAIDISRENRERFMLKVEKTESCWNWLASKHMGYGRVVIDNSPFMAHRVSYALHVEAPPEDLPLDHICRNKGCVNPGHLEPVTLAVNAQRAVPFRRRRPRAQRYITQVDALARRRASGLI